MSLHPELLALLASAKRGGMMEKLALADWLEEHGEPDRASVIRLQMEMSRLRGREPGYQRMEEEVKRLERDYEAQWFGWLREDGQGSSSAKCSHRRGLLYLEIDHEGLNRIARPEFAWVASLLVSDEDLHVEEARLLAESPQLVHLTKLDLRCSRFEDVSVVVLAASPYLANLTHLNLACTGVRSDGAQSVASSPHLANLVELDLGFNEMSDWGAQALARSRYLSKLTRLDLSSNQIEEMGAQALAESSILANLRELVLDSNAIGDVGARALARSPHLANLTLLDLSDNQIGDGGALALAKTPYLANITSLRLWHNQITEDGSEVLRERFGDRVMV